MDKKRVRLWVDLFDLADQKAEVLNSLTARDLTKEILREFDDFPFLDRHNPDAYALSIKGEEKFLDPAATMIALNMADNDHVELKEKSRPTPKGAQSAKEDVYLRDGQTERVFKLPWFPAIIGRSDPLLENEHFLVVDLQTFPNWQRVSRRHARIVQEKGKLYLEGLSPNPVILNEEQSLAAGDKREIKPGDKITLGRSAITLELITRERVVVESEPT